jgi:hypothetical protein
MTEISKPTLGEQMKGAVGSIFGTTKSVPQRKTYSEIVSVFNETKLDLNNLVEERDSHIAGVESKISDLEKEKAEAVEEKGNALATLDFLDKFVK